MTHALKRTSPKGKDQPFIGTCIKCGATHLPEKAVFYSCPADDTMTDDGALIQILEDAQAEVEAATGIDRKEP